MRAVIIHAPKDLRIESFPDPAPGAGEVRVKIAAGGICGSDLHYYHHGGFGTVRIQQPMALGHEIAGVVAAVGDGVASCGRHARCGQSEPAVRRLHPLPRRDAQSVPRHALHGQRDAVSACAGRFSRNPYGRRDAGDADRRHAVAGEAAMAEPLAVCLHAGKQAGPLLGKRVLVTGCGPIGALMVWSRAWRRVRNRRHRCRRRAARGRAKARRDAPSTSRRMPTALDP